MKTIQYLTLIIGLFLGSCQTNEKDQQLYEEGISLELAQLRKQEIKDLKYGLSFSIPEQKQEAVKGEHGFSSLSNVRKKSFSTSAKMQIKSRRFPSMGNHAHIVSSTNISSYRSLPAKRVKTKSISASLPVTNRSTAMTNIFILCWCPTVPAPSFHALNNPT